MAPDNQVFVYILNSVANFFEFITTTTPIQETHLNFDYVEYIK